MALFQTVAPVLVGTPCAVSHRAIFAIDSPSCEVAAEDLAHDRRLGLVDLEDRVGVLGALHIPVAIRRAGEHRHRAGPGAMQLPATAALGDLRPLVLGDHPLELTQQLILRGAASAPAPSRTPPRHPARWNSSSSSTW